MGSNTFVQADIWTVAQTDQGNVVLIRPKESDMVVPIFIGQLETQSILIGLGQVAMPRPQTHDLLMTMLKTLNAELVRVEIRDLSERTFFANLVIKTADGEVTIDARPSDAISLAVRCHAALFIAEDIVEAAGVPVDMIGEPGAASASGGTEHGSVDKSQLSEEREQERQRLLAELELAISIEDYERAAELRDRLRGSSASI